MAFRPPTWLRTRAGASPALCAFALTAVASCRGDSAEAPIVESVEFATSLAGARPAHRGMRTVELQERGVRYVTVEQVFDDGLADVGLRLVSVDGNPPDPVKALRYASSGRWLHAQRVPRIDATRAQGSYDVSILSKDETVAGRPAVRLRFEPRRTVAGALEIWVDATGLQLRVDRFDRTGKPLSSMRYESIQIGAVEREAGDPPMLPEPAETVAPSELSFRPMTPGLGIEGFDLVETSAVRVPLDGRSVSFQRERYTDGVESFIVLQSDPQDRIFGPPLPPEPTGDTKLNYDGVGGVSTVWCTREGRTLAAIGRVGERELAELLVRYAPR